MKNYFLLMSFILLMSQTTFSQIEPLPRVSSGRIERLRNFKTKLITPRNIDIWLPDGYNKNEKYAVLYMHDGQMLFDSTTTWNKQAWGVDKVISKLVDKKIIKKCIVVGIWNGGKGRHSEYFPQKPFESLPRNFKDSIIEATKKNPETALFSTKIQSDNYLKFIVTELKPYIDKYYSTYADQKNTFIVGSSMGGLISMYALCEYPNIFGGAACLSTHWIGTFKDNQLIPEAFANYLKTNLPDPSTHKIYFDYGTKTLDAFYEPYQLNVDAIMKSKGYTDANWKTMKFEGDDHSEKSWNKRFRFPLIFLMKN